MYWKAVAILGIWIGAGAGVVALVLNSSKPGIVAIVSLGAFVFALVATIFVTDAKCK